jgi:hypothetical protein
MAVPAIASNKIVRMNGACDFIAEPPRQYQETQAELFEQIRFAMQHDSSASWAHPRPNLPRYRKPAQEEAPVGIACGVLQLTGGFNRVVDQLDLLQGRLAIGTRRSRRCSLGFLA